MKKIIIGSVSLLAGVILYIGIIIAGVINFQNVTGWPGTIQDRLWASITNLSLRIPFILAIIFAIIGLVILTVEYFNANK